MVTTKQPDPERSRRQDSSVEERKLHQNFVATARYTDASATMSQSNRKMKRKNLTDAEMATVNAAATILGVESKHLVAAAVSLKMLVDSNETSEEDDMDNMNEEGPRGNDNRLLDGSGQRQASSYDSGAEALTGNTNEFPTAEITGHDFFEQAPMFHDHQISLSNSEGFTDPESYYRGNQSGLSGPHEAINNMDLEWPSINENENLGMNAFQHQDHWRLQPLGMNNPQVMGDALMDTMASGNMEEPQTEHFMTDLLTFDAESDGSYQPSGANTTVAAIPPSWTASIPSTSNMSASNGVMGSIQLTISHSADSEAQGALHTSRHATRGDGISPNMRPPSNVPLRMKSSDKGPGTKSEAPSSAFDQLLNARVLTGSSSLGKPRQSQQRRRSDAKGVTHRRRGKYTAEEKRSVAETRKMKACSRCHNHKIKCNPNQADREGPCLNCLVRTTRVAWRLPCLRARIVDALVSRRGFRGNIKAPYLEPANYWEHGQDPLKGAWKSFNSKTLCLTQNFGFSAPTVQIAVSEFLPVEGEKMTYNWAVESEMRSWTLPPYAISHLDAAATQIKEHLTNNIVVYLKIMLQGSDDFVRYIFDLALENINGSAQSQLLGAVLQLWVACRLTEGNWKICGGETLGMMPQNDQNSPYYGRIPMPLVMSEQVTRILTLQVIGPLREDILRELGQIFRERDPSRWFSMFLTIFVLVNNSERCVKHNRNYAARHRLPGLFGNFKLVEELLEGANNVLHHFHDLYNGQKPFTLDWHSGKVDIPGLSHPQKEAIYHVTQKVRERANLFSLLRSRERFGDDMSLASQIFDQKWEPAKFRP